MRNSVCHSRQVVCTSGKVFLTDNLLSHERKFVNGSKAFLMLKGHNDNMTHVVCPDYIHTTHIHTTQNLAK